MEKEISVETKEEKINMDEKVTVRNIAPWIVSFPNRVNSGDTVVQPKSTVRVKREEIVEQIAIGNKLFKGIDENGSHATLYIEDALTRKMLEFDVGKTTQNVVSNNKIKELFSIKDFDEFEKAIKESIITMAEKQFLLSAIKELKLDSYEKISFCERYCKFSLTGR